MPAMTWPRPALGALAMSLTLATALAQNAPAPGNTAIPAARPAPGNAANPAPKPAAPAAQPPAAAPKTTEPAKTPPATTAKPADAKPGPPNPSTAPPQAATGTPQDKPADAPPADDPPKKKAGAEAPPCVVADFRAIGIDTQDAEKRRARALAWIARRGKQCSAQQLLVLRNNRAQWLGNGDSGAVAASIDSLLEVFAETNPDIALLLYGTPPPPPPPPDPKAKNAPGK